VPFIVQDRQALNAAAYKEAYNPALCGPDPVAAGGTGPWPAPEPDAFLVGSTRPPMPNEMGWKDTVTVYPGEVVRLLVPFGAEAAPDLPFGATNLGSYVWHCHILEHEDMDMMQRFEIVRRGH
jgi:FtsP/CotA-like multicopper oxidase with cupredoxin domain